MIKTNVETLKIKCFYLITRRNEKEREREHKKRDSNKNAEFVSTSFSCGLSSGEMKFVFSGEMKLQI